MKSVWILNFYLGIAGSAASTIQSFAFAPANVVMGWGGNEKFQFSNGGSEMKYLCGYAINLLQVRLCSRSGVTVHISA